MDAKRRKTCKKERSSPRQSPSSSKWPTVSELVEGDVSSVVNSLNKLKKVVNSKEAAHLFVSSDDYLSTLLKVSERAFSLIDLEDKWKTVLQLGLSCLANVCNFSREACVELKRPHYKLASIVGSVLENTVAFSDGAVHATILRLLGNMAQQKVVTLLIGLQNPLIEKVASLLFAEESSSAVQFQAFRVFRNVCSVSARGFLAANGGALVMRFLLSPACQMEMKKQALDCLASLTRLSPKHTARQLASLDCGEWVLSELFCSDEDVRRLLLHLCSISSDVRERLGEVDAITRVVQSLGSAEEDSIQRDRCSFLSTFTMDAWGRAQLREGGGLSLLVTRVERSSEWWERSSLIGCFRHLIHDTRSLAFLARTPLFIDTLMQHFNLYAQRYGQECEPEALSVDDDFQPSGLNAQPFDFHSSISLNDVHSGSLSPGSQSSAHSFPLSPPSSSMLSPAQSSPLSSPCSSIADSVYSTVSTNEMDSADDCNANVEPAMKREKQLMKQTVENELWLMSWQANEDANLTSFMRTDLVSSLLSLVRRVGWSGRRVGRILTRLSSSRIGLELLLDMHLHSRVLLSFCAVPCRIARFARKCARCEANAQLGSQILRSISENLQSNFGQSLLMQRLTSEKKSIRIAAAIAKVTLIRNRIRLSHRISSNHPSAVEMLLEELRLLLNQQPSFSGPSFYDGGPPTTVLIVNAFSTLLDPKKICEVLQVDSPWQAPDFMNCRLSASRANDDLNKAEKKESMTGNEEDRRELTDEELIFEDGKGVLIGQVRMEDVCRSSQYFQGMFSHDLLENREKKRKFVLDEGEEHCTRTEFSIFLHALAGCVGPLCIPVNSTETCLRLIRLADKYLVNGLTRHLLDARGPCLRLLDGSSLHHFFPLVLLLFAHPKLVDACVVTLLRFSSEEQALATLSSIACNPVDVESFISSLSQLVHSSLPSTSQSNLFL